MERPFYVILGCYGFNYVLLYTTLLNLCIIWLPCGYKVENLTQCEKCHLRKLYAKWLFKEIKSVNFSVNMLLGHRWYISLFFATVRTYHCSLIFKHSQSYVNHIHLAIVLGWRLLIFGNSVGLKGSCVNNNNYRPLNFFERRII